MYTALYSVHFALRPVNGEAAAQSTAWLRTYTHEVLSIDDCALRRTRVLIVTAPYRFDLIVTRFGFTTRWCTRGGSKFRLARLDRFELSTCFRHDTPCVTK